MKLFQTWVLVSVLACAYQTIKCMDVESITPDQTLLDKLVTFHKPTGTTDTSPKPALASFQKPGRLFVAQMVLFSGRDPQFNRYFTFKTDEGIAHLVKGVQNGGGSQINWFYCDEPTVVLDQKPKIIKILGDNK